MYKRNIILKLMIVMLAGVITLIAFKNVTAKTKAGEGTLLPDAVPIKFFISDSKGNWQTTLSVKSRDGSFKGTYSTDRNEKNVHISRFYGKFNDIKKINSYTYSMSLDTLNFKNQIGEEWDEQGTHYIACEPYGLKSGHTYIFYTSKTPMAEFYKKFSKDELKKWFPDYSESEKPKGLLSRFVLTDSETGSTFITDRVLMKKDIKKNKKTAKRKKKAIKKIPIKKNMLPAKFFFTKDGDEWGTTISITKKSGNFNGICENTKGSGYKFSGEFGNIKKLNQYSYSMTVKKLKAASDADGTDNKELPYGLKKGVRFVLYMPNTPMEVIEKKYGEKYLSWLLPYNTIPDKETEGMLSGYVLHNKKMGFGYYVKQ